MSRAAAAFGAVVLAACSPAAGDGPNLLVPDDVEVRWSPTFDAEGDGLAALVPVDFMVYDAQSGEPLGGVPLRVQGPEALTRDDAALWIVAPEDVDLSTGACDVCAVWWDAWRDQYFEFAPDADPGSALSTETDATGLARVFVFADRFGPPLDARAATEREVFQPALVTVSIAPDGLGTDDAEAAAYGDETFLLVPR